MWLQDAELTQRERCKRVKRLLEEGCWFEPGERKPGSSYGGEMKAEKGMRVNMRGD